MPFLERARALFSEDPIQARALAAWRVAECHVRERWDWFLVAERDARELAFAAYMRALDCEAAAADRLAALFAIDQAA